jgi:hypothetical protein
MLAKWSDVYDTCAMGCVASAVHMRMYSIHSLPASTPVVSGHNICALLSRRPLLAQLDHYFQQHWGSSSCLTRELTSRTRGFARPSRSPNSLAEPEHHGAERARLHARSLRTVLTRARARGMSVGIEAGPAVTILFWLQSLVSKIAIGSRSSSA